MGKSAAYRACCMASLDSYCEKQHASHICTAPHYTRALHIGVAIIKCELFIRKASPKKEHRARSILNFFSNM